MSAARFLFCKLCAHFLQVITLFTPETILYVQQTRASITFSVTFFKQYREKKEKKIVPKCGAIREAFVLDQSNSPCLLNACECGPSDRSLTCPPQRYLGTSSQAFSVGKKGDTPDTSPHSTPLLPLNTSSTSMGTCIKKLLHSIPHTATYKKEFSLSLLSHQLSFSLPSLSFSAGTCNYLMPGRQVLSRGVRPGAS